MRCGAAVSRIAQTGRSEGFRVPNERNGLNTLSRLMVDKITTVPKNKLGHRIGRLDVKDIERVDQAILIFLGLGG